MYYALSDESRQRHAPRITLTSCGKYTFRRTKIFTLGIASFIRLEASWKLSSQYVSIPLAHEANHMDFDSVECTYESVIDTWEETLLCLPSLMYNEGCTSLQRPVVSR